MTALKAGAIRVSEIFGPTIQGEGHVIGLPTVFVRIGGCDFRCSWCDSLHAVLPQYRKDWAPMQPGEIAAEVSRLSGGAGILVTLSGGNPALFNLGELCDALHRAGHTIAVETQGTLAPPWLALAEYLTISPKPPSAGNTTTQEQVEACLAAATGAVCIKVVVFDEKDLDWFGKLYEALRDNPRYTGVTWTVQVGNPDVNLHQGTYEEDQLRRALLERLARLADSVVERRWYGVRVLPQLHTLLWGNRRGV